MKTNAKGIRPSFVMACAASRELAGKNVAFIGVGIPMVAAYLAQRIHNPELRMVIELGVVAPKAERLPLALTDPTLVKNANCTCDMLTSLGVLLHYVDIGFIGGAQVDKYGNLNTTVIGDYYNPTARLVGSGGANDIASIAKTYVIVMKQKKDRFVEKVDYVTTVGHYKGYNSRKSLGLRGSGPQCIISDMAVFRFDETSKELYIESYHPTFTLDQVQENLGYNVKVSPDVKETALPTPQELTILNEMDPGGYYLG